jgi:hypothetical protein
MEFKPGMILNFYWKNLTSIGNLIHYGELGATHSAFVVFTDKKGVFVAEALDNGIVGSYYENWWLDARLSDGKMKVGTSHVPLDPNKVKEFFTKHDGDKYDWKSLWDIVVYWFTGKSNVATSDDDTWICSEIVASMLKYSSNNKIDIVKELKLPHESYCSPMDLAKSSLLKWSDK